MFSAPKAKRQVHELKTPQATSCTTCLRRVTAGAVFCLPVEEAEAMPAESVRLKRKSNEINKKRELTLVMYYDFSDSSP